MPRLSAFDHEILGDDFDEIHWHGSLEEVAIVFLAQANTVT
jgi:hypothetical protein